MIHKLVHSDQIKRVVDILKKDTTYLSARYGSEDLYTKGYAQAVQVTVKHLERLIPREPKQGEAWLIEVKPSNAEPYRVAALRSESEGFWETLEDCFSDNSPHYEVTEISPLTPENKEN